MIFAVSFGMFQGISCNFNKDAKSTSVTPLYENLKYGFPEDEYFFQSVNVKPNQFLSDILGQFNVTDGVISQIASQAKEVYSVRKIQSGKELTFVSKDSCSLPFCFIYEPNPFSYVVYDYGNDSIDVCRNYREHDVCVETASGEIKTSLWSAMIENGLSPAIIDKMEDALASSVDFYHTQKGDQFKLLFERKYIEGKPISIGKILGAFYKNDQGEHYSIYYETEKYEGYYDEQGRASTSKFLRSPVKYSRISSRFNKNRFHPILKRRKAHLGTDYAAAYGTPIRSVSDGVVVRRGYTEGNGKYIKVKHDGTYQTQYLHMQKFAKGVKKGTKVRQGQTIGYVGSTGLATGPHVCFRFWKNGKQINHLREIFPPAKPMKAEDLPSFYEYRDDVVYQLDTVLSPDQINQEIVSTNP